VVAAIAACSPMLDVKYEIDQGTKFEMYKTYDWMAGPDVRPDDEVFADLQKYKTLDNHLRLVIYDELGKKEVDRETDNPDLLAKYYLGVQSKMTLNDPWGIRYSDFEYRDKIRSSAYFIIDFIDAKTKQRVWRGQAHIAINVDPSEEMVDKNVRRAVQKLLEQFPPTEDYWYGK
jgi:hypothetical protein